MSWEPWLAAKPPLALTLALTNDGRHTCAGNCATTLGSSPTPVIFSQFRGLRFFPLIGF